MSSSATRFLFDTNVFVYATGGEHFYRVHCQRIVERQIARELQGEGSVEMVQEYLHVSMGRKPVATAVKRARDVADFCAQLHELTIKDLRVAFDLVERDGLVVRDALLAATALNRDVGFIMSADRDFDRVEGITRVDPADEQAVMQLI